MITCVVCGKVPEVSWFYHARLNVYVCDKCPLDDVCGEDIADHTMTWGKGPVLEKWYD